MGISKPVIYSPQVGQVSVWCLKWQTCATSYPFQWCHRFAKIPYLYLCFILIPSVFLNKAGHAVYIAKSVATYNVYYLSINSKIGSSDDKDEGRKGNK